MYVIYVITMSIVVTMFTVDTKCLQKIVTYFLVTRFEIFYLYE